MTEPGQVALPNPLKGEIDAGGKPSPECLNGSGDPAGPRVRRSTSAAAATATKVGTDRREPATVPPAADEDSPHWSAAYGALPGGEELVDSPRANAKLARAAAARPRVMLVDDEELVLSCVARVLGRCGYEVIVRNLPEEALRDFEAEPHGFDAVITDYRMPVMNGIQLSERMIAERPDVAILIVSGCPSDIDPGFVKALGIRGVLTKPVDASQLTAALERIVVPGRSPAGVPATLT